MLDSEGSRNRGSCSSKTLPIYLTSLLSVFLFLFPFLLFPVLVFDTEASIFGAPPCGERMDWVPAQGPSGSITLRVEGTISAV